MEINRIRSKKIQFNEKTTIYWKKILHIEKKIQYIENEANILQIDSQERKLIR